MKNLKIFLVTGFAAQILCYSPVLKAALKQCPDKPNCVSSQETGKHRTEPLSVKVQDRAEIVENLKKVMSQISRSSLVEERKDYLHYEVRTSFFGFVDDVEFEIPADASLIHVRSASRTGYYDFNKNKKRVKKIRSLLSSF